MKNKIAMGFIFMVLSWWVIDEYLEGVEFDRVMEEHHAHFELVSDWHDEWRGLVDEYLVVWNSQHQDCGEDNE